MRSALALLLVGCTYVVTESACLAETQQQKCDAGAADHCEAVAWQYVYGVELAGIGKCTRKAVEYFARACKMGLKSSCKVGLLKAIRQERNSLLGIDFQDRPNAAGVVERKRSDAAKYNDYWRTQEMISDLDDLKRLLTKPGATASCEEDRPQ